MSFLKALLFLLRNEIKKTREQKDESAGTVPNVFEHCLEQKNFSKKCLISLQDTIL